MASAPLRMRGDAKRSLHVSGSVALTFVLAVSSICAEEAAMPPHSEKAIIKQLERGGANVVEKDDGL